jgi:hypothetical protein
MELLHEVIPAGSSFAVVTREAESRELEDFAVHKIAAPESPWPKNQQAPQYKTLTVELIVGTN